MQSFSKSILNKAEATSTELTHPQMNIWSGQLLSPDEPLYNMVLSFTISGVIDEDRFKSAFQQLINETDVLRLTVEIENNLPRQYFHEHVESPLIFIDFSKENDPTKGYQEWINENKNYLFLPGELLYQTALMKLDDKKFVWYINHHHLITDGITIHLLYKRLNELYSSEYTEEKKSFKYREIAQSSPFHQLTKSSEYWSGKKETSIPKLYGEKNATRQGGSTRITVPLGKERTKKVQELAMQPGIKGWNSDTSLFNIFLTVLNTLVYKVGGQSIVSTGFASHNRTNQSERQTAGLFMELLPAAIEISNGERLISLFDKVRNETFECLKNTNEAKPPAQLLRIFNTVLNFIPGTFDKFNDYKTSCDWIHSGFSDPSHHIRLQIHDFNGDDDFMLQFDLNDEVFKELNRQVIPKHFIKIIDAFIESSETLIDSIDLIADDELSLIKSWNDTNVEYPTDETLLTKFQTQADKTPEAIALFFEDQEMTYGELDKKSSQFANCLIEKGVAPSDLVAVSLERSFEMIISIYGVLKAGAAYLPIDTSIPEKRFEFIISDASPKLILVNHSNYSSYSSIHPRLCHIKDLRWSEQEEKSPSFKVDQSDLAYVIYTSGSTGQPKGVKCHHKGICNRLNWMREDGLLTEEDTVILKTPFTFDVSIPEIFAPLQVGAKLVIEVPEGHKDSSQLIKSINKHHVTNVHFVPSMLGVFLKHPDAATCLSIKRISCTGEILPAETVNQLFETLDCNVYNLYGPTEASVEVTKWECFKNDTRSNVPIGRPISNTQVYILDGNLKNVPIGVSGELYIGGDQLAEGYLNRVDLTKDKFIDHPFDKKSKSKLYRSGDLARYNNEGVIEYLGRNDTQVKLRGFRIELGEIESVMMEYDRIHQAIVVMKEKEDGSQFLVGYYTGDKLEGAMLDDVIREKLPEYMIPSFYKHMSQFEISSSGKVDRKRLPELDVEARAREQEEVVDPRNQLEELVANMWKEVLNLKRIGVHQHFIQIGGDSLAALSILARLKEELDLDLKPDMIFQKPTIAGFAAYIEQTMLEIMESEK